MTDINAATLPVLPVDTRSCGTCYACCIHLGIAVLKKWPGEHCKHLNGVRGADARCSIYAERPEACSTYKCAWRFGLLDDDQRPNKSGLLVSIYPREPATSPPSFSATVAVCDINLCGDLQKGPMHSVVEHLIATGLDDIRIMYPREKRVIHLLDGNIRRGKLLKASEPEALLFESYEPPIGTYRTLEKKD